MITSFHAKYFSHELTRRHEVNDARRLSQSLFDASVDLNPRQIEAALFALEYENLNRVCDKLTISPADNEFDVIYINGGHNIPKAFTHLETGGSIPRTLKTRQIEPEFLSRMFAVGWRVIAGEIIFCRSDDGMIRLETCLENDTLWLTQRQMAELFQTSKQNISHHIREEGELAAEATVKNYLTVEREGNREVQRKIEYYNLDMVISVGYRVKSLIATRFRIWATRQLKEYIVRGFVMEDKRLKNSPVAGSAVPDYFDEVLGRVRDIRASERRMYLRVRNIFSLAADYDPSLPETNQFFIIIQNKLPFSATGYTTAELSAGLNAGIL